jgi:hypothetical protein
MTLRFAYFVGLESASDATIDMEHHSRSGTAHSSVPTNAYVTNRGVIAEVDPSGNLDVGESQ